MSLIRSLIGRRQFLIAFISSFTALAFGRFTKAFGLMFNEGVARASESTKPLKAVVVYYSATGATGQYAGAIHRGMKSVMECDVAPLKKMDPKEMAKYDVVAIGGPIWYFRETANLRLYIYKMPNMAGKLCIPFCSHGGSPSGFFFSLNQALRKKEFTIIGWNDWYGDATHVLHMPQPYLTGGHPDEIDLQEAEVFGREMAERVVRIYAGERNLIPEIPEGADADPLWIKNYGNSGGSGGSRGTTGAGAAAGSSGGGGRQGAGSSMPGSTAAGVVAGGAAGAGSSPRGMSVGGTSAAPSGQMAPFGASSSGSAATPAGQMAPFGASSAGSGGGGGPGGGAEEEIPHIDTAKCVYPRCTACVDNCVVGAIDLSMTSPVSWLSGTPIFVKGCIHCAQPLCERSCAYDAITYQQAKTNHVYDMTKCTYPKCTLCRDNCLMDSIDFSQIPPVVHNNCEGCDLCWCICPYDAISISNLAETHMRLVPTRERSFNNILVQAEAKGKFRRLVPFDKVGWENNVFKNPNAPRVVLHEKNYPYEVKEG